MLNENMIDAMVHAALDIIRNAYAPYSHVGIGACVLASDGTLYAGCNIENAVRGLSVCAGEVALYRAIADGKREFDGIAVISDSQRPFAPNGALCQILSEFDVPEVVMADMYGNVKVVQLSDLLPYGAETRENGREAEPADEDE